MWPIASWWCSRVVSAPPAAARGAAAWPVRRRCPSHALLASSPRSPLSLRTPAHGSRQARRASSRHRQAQTLQTTVAWLSSICSVAGSSGQKKGGGGGQGVGQGEAGQSTRKKHGEGEEGERGAGVVVKVQAVRVKRREWQRRAKGKIARARAAGVQGGRRRVAVSTSRREGRRKRKGACSEAQCQQALAVRNSGEASRAAWA